MGSVVVVMNTRGDVSVRMSELAEKEKLIDKKNNGGKSGVQAKNDVQKQSLASQMKKKVASDCIIVVGTTGLGKTTCINLYTGQNLPTGDQAQSVTSDIVTVADEIHGPKAPMCWTHLAGPT